MDGHIFLTIFFCCGKICHTIYCKERTDMTKTNKIFRIFCIILAILFFVLEFLLAPRMMSKPDMSAVEGTYFAHRGYFDNNSSAPENSLASFELAVEKGFGIELDIQLSSDGVAMVFHDADLERVCGVEGKIWDYTAEELSQMKLMGSEETIPTFEQALAVIDGRAPLLVEYKMDRVDTAVCAAGQALLDEYDGDYVIQAFDPRALMWYKKNAPQVARGQLAKQYWEEEEYKGEALYVVLGNLLTNVATRPDFVSYEFSDKNNRAFKLYDLLGGKTACWTLRSEEDYAQVKGKFDMYIFDSFDISEQW